LKINLHIGQTLPDFLPLTTAVPENQVFHWQNIFAPHRQRLAVEQARAWQFSPARQQTFHSASACSRESRPASAALTD